MLLSAATGLGPAAGTGGTRDANGDVTMTEEVFAAVVTSPLASRVPPVPAAGPSPVAVEAAPVQALFTVMERVVLLTETLLRQQPWHLLLTVRVRLTVLS